jgi:hypothetical protein
MDTVYVTWRGGARWPLSEGTCQRIDAKPSALDGWLHVRGASRRHLSFGGSPALEQKFINDFGPRPSR